MTVNFRQPTGMVLVLTLLIIAAVIAAAGTFGTLIIKSIQQSRLVDNAIQAYYVAESGSERALYQTRQRDALPQCPGGQTCGDNGYCGGDLANGTCLTKSQGNLAAAVSDWLVVADNELETIIKLNKGDSFQLDLFNPLQVKEAGIKTVRIEELTSSDGLASVKLYGELTNLTKVLNILNADGNCLIQPSVFKDFITVDQDISVVPPVYQTAVSSLSGQDILQACSYIFRLSLPLDSPLNWVKFKIKVFDDNSNQIKIPSRLIIKSVATFGDSQQNLTVKTPMRPPLSGLYDFVLFSEEEIIK